MVFWEVIVHVLSLDLNWLATFALNNLLWVFLLTVGIYLFQDGKKVLLGLLTFIPIIWISADLKFFYNLSIYTAIGLLLLYWFRLSILLILQHTKKLSKYYKLAWFLSWFVVLYIYNVFFL